MHEWRGEKYTKYISDFFERTWDFGESAIEEFAYPLIRPTTKSFERAIAFEITNTNLVIEALEAYGKPKAWEVPWFLKAKSLVYQTRSHLSF